MLRGGVVYPSDEEQFAKTISDLVDTKFLTENVVRVVAEQKPTVENNWTWYRLYSDGWVEQGGRVALNGKISSTNLRIEFPIEMKDVLYRSIVSQDANTGNYLIQVGWQATTGMSVGSATDGAGGATKWKVEGYAKN